jgi:biopolymer transport protein ExbD
VPAYSSFILTSMTDMFTMILIFLLTFVDPTTQNADGVTLPAGTSQQAPEKGVSLTVTPDKVLVEGREVLQLEAGALPSGTARTGRRIDAVYERLAAAASALPASPGPPEQGGSNAVLLVAADRGVPFSVLGELLYTAGQAGFGQFRFVVISTPG